MVFRDNHTECPRCGSSLAGLLTPLGHQIQRCTSCYGNWVDMGTLQHMFARMRFGGALPAMSSRGDGSQVLLCPACMSPMNQRSLNGLELDQCERHGIWFDAEELETTLYCYALAE